MDWVKRNLYFVIGSATALVLMGLAGFYLYSGWKHKNEVFEKLSAQYAELKRLYDLNPNPGNQKVNNTQVAREQQEQLREFIRQSSRFFLTPSAIPGTSGTNKVTSEEFTSALRRTVDELQRDAANSSVTLPPSYSFSFEAQKTLMRFAPGSLDALAVQLGEVKAICGVLFAAKINALDNLRRERVSNDDLKGPPSDYLPGVTGMATGAVTNELAVIVPYEVSFRCFSGELGGVLNGFHSAPHGLLVKTLDVEPASAGPVDPNAPGGMMPDFVSRYGMMPPTGLSSAEAPPVNPYVQRYGMHPEGGPPVSPYGRRYAVGGGAAEGGISESAARRYGMGPEGGGGASLGGVPYRGLPGGAQPGTPYGQPATPYYPSPTPSPGGSTPGRSSLQTVLDEKPLRVTVLIHVVKLLPKETRR